MVKLQLVKTPLVNNTWEVGIPATHKGGKANDWLVAVFCNDGYWGFAIETQSDRVYITNHKLYTRKSHAVRGMNRLIKRLGWPYEVVG